MAEKDLGPNSHRENAYFLIALLIATGVVLFEMMNMFFAPVVLAATFAGLFHPIYKKLLSLTNNRRGLCALVCCVTLLTVLLVPAYLIADLIVKESVALYKTAGSWTNFYLNNETKDTFKKITQIELFSSLDLHQLNWHQTVNDNLKMIAGWITNIINITSRGTLQLVAQLFITFFTMFYFFRDGESLMEQLKYLSPLDERHEKGLIERFASVSRATIKGTLLIGLIQGTLGGITLWMFGFDAPALWGVIMVILSIVPLVGTWLVLYPAALVAFINGEIWSSVAIVLITAVIISSVDNFLRPYLVGRDTGMHDLLVLFSTLGGINLFGVTGFIIGPVFASFFITILEFYSSDHRKNIT